jgi:hypothetical protein
MTIERDPTQLLHDTIVAKVRNEPCAVRGFRHHENPTRQFCFAAGRAECYGIAACVAVGTVCDRQMQGTFFDIFASNSKQNPSPVYIPTDSTTCEVGERLELAFAIGLYGDFADNVRFDPELTEAYRNLLITGHAVIGLWQPE